MNCATANATDLVEYLSSLGQQPAKIRNTDYWYFSPFRNESNPSFKLNRGKNVWFDHGIGHGGKAIDFVMRYFNCHIYEALYKISLFHQQNHLEGTSLNRSENYTRPFDCKSESAIKIISVDEAITNCSLMAYLEKRKIPVDVADAYCKQVSYSVNDKTYTAIGFKNAAGGYELRSEYFKGSSSPKYVSYFDNKANNIVVFEGFFDFLTYPTISRQHAEDMTNFLILNSLSFFERSLLLMEKHDSIHLYLDLDNAGRRCTQMAEKRSIKYKDESKLYKGHKDLNEWLVQADFATRKVKSLRMPF